MWPGVDEEPQYESAAVRVTVEDLKTGDKEAVEVKDDYLVIAAGTCYVAHTQVYPTKGTHVVTIKGRQHA